MIYKVMERRHGFVEEQDFPVVSISMSLWEDVMQERNECVGEDNVNSISALIKPWNVDDKIVTGTEVEDDDIVELATFFIGDDNDDKCNQLLNISSTLEDQVKDELAVRIENKFMIQLARREIEQDTNKACKTIHDIVTKNPRITKKCKFKEIENKLMAEIEKDSKNRNNTFEMNVINNIQMKRNEVMKEDTIGYSELMNVWETGEVMGSGVYGTFK